MHSASIQFDPQGNLRHFLTLDGFERPVLESIMDTAERFSSLSEQSLKKLPLLNGKTVVNLFFETSTRTRTTFELAAKRLSADVLNVNIATSATTKGETLLDTIRNIEAMQVDMFVVRHAQSGAPLFIAQNVAPHIRVINAGDGRHAHPTQAMLDVFTIRKHKPNFESLTVAIVGDILHSRVARSEIQALKILGVPEIRLIGPRTLIPFEAESLGVRIYHDLDQGLSNVDVVIMLRLQRERMAGAFIPSESEYYETFGLTQRRLERANDDVMVMHPGPINRGVEIESSVADGSRSVILQQVTHGIAVRMAIMSMVLGCRVEG